MKLSLFYLPTYLPEVHGTEGQLYQEILAEVAFADQEGFYAVWFSEHHFYAYGGIIPCVPMMGLAAACQTKQIRIGSGVALLPLNDPIRVAEEYAMLDVLSNGRLEFGIGRAFQKCEYDAFNVSMDESRARFNENHDIIMKAWQQAQFSHEGQFRSYNNLSVLPKPIQKPYPPVMVACVITKESFVWTGSHGYNLMYVPYLSTTEEIYERVGWYKDALVSAGHNPAEKDIMLVYHLFVGESDEQALNYAMPFLMRYLQASSDSNNQIVASKDYQTHEKLGQIFAQLSPEYLYPNRVIFGSIETCIKRLTEIKALGTTNCGLVINFGGIPHQSVMQSLERFTKKVVPNLPN